MEKICFITTGYMPIPAVNGGAVETLVEDLIVQNEVYKKYDFELIGTYDEKAFKKSKKYKNTNFVYVKTSKLVAMLDKILYFILVSILKKDKKNSYKFIIKRIEYILKVSKILKKNNYDKIIIENNPTLFLTLKLKNNYKKYEGKYYYHLHNEINKFYGCYKIMRECKSIICISNYIKKYVCDRLSISDDKTVLLKNCIDVERFNKQISNETKSGLMKKYGIENEDVIVLFTGRIVPEKGILELIKAFKMCKSKNLKLMIVGGNFIGKPDKTNFEMQLLDECKNIKDKIIFTCFINYDEIHKIYSLATIAVLPSIWEEPAGLTILEAEASGLPVITTRSGGIPEYIDDKCGLILNKDVNLIYNISKNIDELVNDKKKIFLMKNNSIKYSKNYSLEKYYLNFVNLIKKI